MIGVREEVFSYKKKNPGIDEVDFILHSPGGSADDAYRIIRTLRKNFKTVNLRLKTVGLHGLKTFFRRIHDHDRESDIVFS